MWAMSVPARRSGAAGRAPVGPVGPGLIVMLSGLVAVGLVAACPMPASGTSVAGAVHAGSAHLGAAHVPAPPLRLTLAGQRFGSPATVKIRGLSGRAEHFRRTVTVRSRMRLTGLAPGRYSITPRAIRSADRTARAATVTVRLTTRAGARVTLRYRARTREVAQPVDTVAPGPVSGLQVEDRTETTIRLRWVDPAAPDLREVVVRRAEGTTAPRDPAEGVPVPLAGPGTAVDAGLTANRRYSYAVFTRDVAGNTGPGVSVTAVTVVASLRDADVVAAGDLGWCSRTAFQSVADLVVQSSSGQFWALGDLVYPDGSAQAFAQCYDPALGSVRDRTWAVPGNHDYETPGASGYFGYTGAEQFYRRDIEGWSVFFLDSNCAVVSACEPGSAQYEWLKAELEAGTGRCAAALWHHPRWSSAAHGPDPRLGPLYGLLVDHGVDVLLSGHDHGYERFAPLDAAGVAADAGVRQFVVGTGGADLYAFGAPRPGSEARVSAYGVLALDLSPDSLAWWFVDTNGVTRDQGGAACS